MSDSAGLVRIRLLQLMELKGWKSRDLARATGIAHSAVYRWVNGSGSPSLEALDRIARVLGVTPAALIGSSGTRESSIPKDVLDQLAIFDAVDFDILRTTIRGIIAGKELSAGQKPQKLRKPKA